MASQETHASNPASQGAAPDKDDHTNASIHHAIVSVTTSGPEVDVRMRPYGKIDSTNPCGRATLTTIPEWEG